MIKIKRIYEAPEDSDGFRILIDRLWPRGLSKEKAHIDVWLKDIAPSNELRKWFHHDSARWDEFESRYTEELKDKKIFLDQLKVFENEHKTVTLLYGARNTEQNQAVVLRDILKKK